jgi:hypothetical protein
MRAKPLLVGAADLWARLNSSRGSVVLGLNPYAFGGSILKVEHVNFT